MLRTTSAALAVLAAIAVPAIVSAQSHAMERRTETHVVRTTHTETTNAAPHRAINHHRRMIIHTTHRQYRHHPVTHRRVVHHVTHRHTS